MVLWSAHDSTPILYQLLYRYNRGNLLTQNLATGTPVQMHLELAVSLILQALNTKQHRAMQTVTVTPLIHVAR